MRQELFTGLRLDPDHASLSAMSPRATSRGGGFMGPWCRKRMMARIRKGGRGDGAAGRLASYTEPEQASRRASNQQHPHAGVFRRGQGDAPSGAMDRARRSTGCAAGMSVKRERSVAIENERCRLVPAQRGGPPHRRRVAASGHGGVLAAARVLRGGGQIGIGYVREHCLDRVLGMHSMGRRPVAFGGAQ